MDTTTIAPSAKPSMAGRLGFTNLPRFALLGLQLALLFLVIRQFQIESAAFVRLTALAFGGFAVHYFYLGRRGFIFSPCCRWPVCWWFLASPPRSGWLPSA